MALRIETRIGALLALLAVTAAAQPLSFEVRHKHTRKGVFGTLRVTDSGISFTEPGKKDAHSHEWAYSDIEQLTLGEQFLSILTYQDRAWQLGRDRVYDFDRLPTGSTGALYQRWSQTLDQRFIAALADRNAPALWKTGAKRLHALSGAQGTLLVGPDRIVFDSRDPKASRTWRIKDIDMVSSSGPFDLAITTMERTGWARGSPSEMRFQLKEALSEERYQQLWRIVNRNKGLQVLATPTGGIWEK